MPEALVPACVELEEAFRDAWADEAFVDAVPPPLARVRRAPHARDAAAATLRAPRHYASSPSERTWPTRARTRSTTSLARRCSPSAWARRRVIAETGAGQHGVATATAAARTGPRVHGVHGRGGHACARSSTSFAWSCSAPRSCRSRRDPRTLKDAVNEALREWVTCVADTHYCLGSVMGPHPFPWMVREFQSVIGREAAAAARRTRRRERPTRSSRAWAAARTRPGVFAGFADTAARLYGVEAARGRRVRSGSPGVLHGMRSMLLQDEFGQIEEAHSISAGLDYPGIGPEHAYLAETGRAEYFAVGDEDVIPRDAAAERDARASSRPLRPAHALAWIVREAGALLPRRLHGAAQPFGTGRQGRRPGPTRSCGASREHRSRSSCAFCARAGARRSCPTSSRGLNTGLDATRRSRGARRGRRRSKIGMPFSDPMMDGVVIQEAGLIALERGTTFDSICRGARGDSNSACPSIAMTYYNIFLHYGLGEQRGNWARLE